MGAVEIKTFDFGVYVKAPSFLESPTWGVHKDYEVLSNVPALGLPS